jgi:hypothetical protein
MFATFGATLPVPLDRRGPAGLGHRDDPGPAIGRGLPALGQPAPLQVVDGAEHRRLVEVDEGGELDLRRVPRCSREPAPLMDLDRRWCRAVTPDPAHSPYKKS